MNGRTLAFAVIALLAPPAHAAVLDDVLACRLDAIAAETPASLAQALAGDARFACRDRLTRVGTQVECDATRDLAAFGLPTREFGTLQGNDGERRIRIVFRAAAPRVRDAVAARTRATFTATDDGFAATTDGHSLQVLPREDGSTVLACVQRPARDEADAIAQGLDGERGGIAGRLAFPGAGDLPPMRVCAVPRDATLRPRCLVTAAGTGDYLITGLAPGLYDVVTFALARNSNGWVGAHASRLGDCAANRTDCAGGVLVPVDVRPGATVTDIDPDRFYTALPPRFDVVRTAGDEP